MKFAEPNKFHRKFGVWGTLVRGEETSHRLPALVYRRADFRLVNAPDPLHSLRG
jgi:hypothetical protein